jgi:hypothetical protein
MSEQFIATLAMPPCNAIPKPGLVSYTAVTSKVPEVVKKSIFC